MAVGWSGRLFRAEGWSRYPESMVSGAQRGRPKTFDDQVLLEKSMETFWRHGLNGATTRVLEQELGIGQSSLYNTFGSKDRLLEQSLVRYEEQLNATVFSCLKEPGRDAVLTFIDRVAEWVSNDDRRGCLVMNLAQEAPEHAHRLKAYRVKLRRSLKPSLRTFIDSPDLVDSRTDLIVAGILGLNVSARSGASAAELRRLAGAIREQVAAW